jgi:hypothetical protein
MRKNLLNMFFLVLIIEGTPVRGKSEASDSPQSPIGVTGFVDTYYGHDSNFDGRKRPYTTQASYNDELAVNLGYIDVSLTAEEYRGRIAAQAGSSVDSNYAAEPDEGWRYVQEAYGGIKLGQGLWVDAGVFFSHIGMEGWISRDNINYTRSLVAEYSPYYQTGVRLNYKIDDQWTFQILGLRGWQNITEKRDPALGTQLQYEASDQLTFLHNLFVGNENGQRVFNDFIAKYTLSDSTQIAGQVDVGYQRIASQEMDAWWHGWSIVGQHRVTPKLAIGARLEHFLDPHQVIVASLGSESFGAFGASLNFDYELCSGLMWRNEVRRLQDAKDVFPDGSNGLQKSSTLIVTSLSLSLS